MMFRGPLLNPTIIFLLVASFSLVWSKKTPIYKSTTEASTQLESLKAATRAPPSKSPTFQEASESKLRSRYSGNHGDHYILNEDDHHGDKKGKDFVEEEDHEEYNGEEHDKGYLNEDKKLDDETLKDHANKGSQLDFKEGGASFDKHHKDHMAENKENENVNEHDEGEKFGSEALKEHKLGKHREKSVGHKKHGFKNVYHKEEYGDHKTFHDEFLDNDHHHEYDDQHENRKLEGGRFSKGFLREGENKELNEGDEKHAWGKGGHDSHDEGHYEEGGHLSGRVQGHKKREGHHEATGHKNKHSSHKLKKGEDPQIGSHHSSHHGSDKPQYYARSHNSHKSTPVHDVATGHADAGHHPHRNSGHYNHDPEPHAYEDIGYNQDGVLYPGEVRTPTHARRLEIAEELEPSKIEKNLPPVVPVDHAPKPIAPQKHSSFYYRRPLTEVLEQPHPKEMNHIGRHNIHNSLQEPRIHHHKPSSVQSHLQKDPQVHPHNHHHHHSAIFPTQPEERNHQSGSRPQHHDHRHHQHHHFASQPFREHQLNGNNHHQPSSNSENSKPYPWWQHSRTHKRHHHGPSDSEQASSQDSFGQEIAPGLFNVWVPKSKYRYSEPYEHRASGHHYGYARAPEVFRGRFHKRYHRHSPDD